MAEAEIEFYGAERSDKDEELIDIEEIGADSGILFDSNVFLEKLRGKPQFPIQTTECGTKWPKKSFKDWKIAVGDRLSLHALTPLDLLKQNISYPDGCLPPLSLPAWHCMPLEKKIPMLQSPAGLFYYTRRKLATKLHRAEIAYNVKDPYNLERVVGAPYTALHDPHVKSLLRSPLTRRILLKQGFINSSDEVLCSLRDFNKFRDYLRTLYCDQVWNEIEACDTFVKSERKQLRALLNAESNAEGKQAKVAARIAAAKKFQLDSVEFKKKKQQHQDRIMESRLRQWRTEKDRKLLEHIMKSIEGSRRMREKLEALYDLRLQQRRNTLTKSARKLLDTTERQQNDKAMMQAAFNKFKVEWIEAKYVYSYDKLVNRKQLQEDLRASLKYRAKKRQQRLERYREEMPRIMENRKAEAERIMGIVRKFAMRWLDRVRKRLNAPKDVKHESCWIGQSKGVLDDTVKYLRQESGYEKLDDFILNIMKLKKQIQAQIELEEAEEAALAAAAAERGEDGEVETVDNAEEEEEAEEAK